MNILFYGNCQCACLYSIFNLQKYFNVKLLMVHECYTINKDDFDKIIFDANIIITQPISDNYKGKNYLSTKYVIENKSFNANVIIFPSLHFDFYYIDLQYIFKNNIIFDKPHAYHYKYMMEYITKKKNV